MIVCVRTKANFPFTAISRRIFISTSGVTPGSHKSTHLIVDGLFVGTQNFDSIVIGVPLHVSKIFPSS
jgi:hypothetical protein